MRHRAPPVVLTALGLLALAGGCSQAPQAAPPATAERPARQAAPAAAASAPAADPGPEPFALDSLQPEGDQAGDGRARRVPDVVFVPTPHPVVDEMLRIAEVGADDVLYDLGSGDGRIPIAAARRWGTRGVGIDIDPQRIREADRAAEQAGVTGKVEFIEGDLFEADLSEATVITLYLLPELNLRLRPKLLQLEPGTRIVSHNYHMGDWQPQQQRIVGDSVVYLWTVPETPPVLTDAAAVLIEPVDR